MGNKNDKNLQLMDLKPKACCNNFSLYISNGKIDSSDLTCSVCFTVFSSPRILKCKHVFCQDCIQEWAKGNTLTCPLCRMESKRTRGSFGRADKRLQNKIIKLFMKCRNCCWTGSYCQFMTQFSIQPYLDDQAIPCEKIREEKDGQEKQVVEEKVQARQVGIEVQKSEQVRVKDDEDGVIELLKINKSSQGYEVFIEDVFRLDKTQSLFNPFGDQLFAQNDRIPLQVNDNIGVQRNE